MDLQKLKLDSEIYGNSIQKTITIINEYINLYEEYNLLYKQKLSTWINITREEFIKIYSDLDFILETKKNNYNLGYEEGKTIYEIATFNTLEFKLMLSSTDGIYTDIRFLQTKPSISEINMEINPNIKKYRNNIELNRSRDGISINQYSSHNSINKLIEVKTYIENSNFKLEHIEETYSTMKNTLSELHLRLDKLKNNNIIGEVKINKETIVIESLSKLIELL